MYLAQVNYDRRNYNSKDLTYTGLNAAQQLAKKKMHATDLNIEARIELFQEQLKNENVYRIPLRYFSGIGKINFPTKTDYRTKLFLETKMEKLFESRKVLAAGAAIPITDTKIIFKKAPFIQYKQILLDKNFRHLETIIVSKKILRMGAQKTPLQKTYEISAGTDSLNVEFLGSNRQFDWLEISIVPGKSDKHTTIYDSYNRELASQEIKTLKLTNFTEIYSLANEKNMI